MEQHEPLPKRIGILADSHDRLDALKRAVRLLEDRGADRLVHVGDLCDSLRLDLLDAAVRLVTDHRILAVKGNNDFMLETLLINRHTSPDPLAESLVAFLQALPMYIQWQGLCFAHSLPFEALRSFYEPIDNGSTRMAREVFRMTSHRLLFCGHSHRPTLFRWDGKKAHREGPPPIGASSLDARHRHIVVTGAVVESECVLFDTEGWILERLRIPAS